MRARIVALLLLFPPFPLGAQQWPSPVAAHVAVRETLPAAAPVRFAMPRAVASDRDESNQIAAMLFGLGAPVIGAVSGAIYQDACFGNGETLSGRAALSGLAMGISFGILGELLRGPAERDSVRTPAPPESDSARRARERRENRVLPFVVVAGGAALGAIVGAPIGAERGHSVGERCHGGMPGATLAATGQMAVGGAVTGAGLIAVAVVSDLVSGLTGKRK